MKRHFPTLLNIKRTHRIAIMVLLGLILFAVLLFWRSEYLAAQKYVNFPIRTERSANKGEMRSANYQLKTEELSPSVK